MRTGVSVTVSNETHERLKLYSDVTGKSIRDTIDEALNFWLDTAGAAEILLETGVETVPELAATQSSIEPHDRTTDIIPIDSFPPVNMAGLGHC